LSAELAAEAVGKQACWELDLIQDDPTWTIGPHTHPAPVLESGLEEGLLRDRDPSLLVDDRLAALSELALVLGGLDRC
jgi:hypothetical protein